jgi:hypothetical protein
MLVTETFMDNQSHAVASAIEEYFNLMYDADDDRFPGVFHDACLIHGMREGKFMVWSASDFRNIMRSRRSPATVNSPRDQEIMSIDIIAPDLAATKVRVRIGQTCFIDHLTFHRVDGDWLITSKAFHVAQVFPPGS